MLVNQKNSSILAVRNPYTWCYTSTIFYYYADKGVVSHSNCSNTLGVSQLTRTTPLFGYTSCFLFNAKPEQK